MKLSTLIDKLFKSSEFAPHADTLAKHTGQTQPFTSAFLKGNKVAREKEDVLFDALTKGITADELIAAIELVKAVKLNQIEKEQFV